MRKADGTVDPDKVGPDGYPAVDYSDYAPSFLVDTKTLHPGSNGWHGNVDVKTQHEFKLSAAESSFKNDYWNASAMVGYALDEKTDVQAQYYYYRANDHNNNSFVGLPLGAGAEENGVTATLIRQLSRSVRWTLKYGFFSNHDQLYASHRDYTAHLVYSSLQYRF